MDNPQCHAWSKYLLREFVNYLLGTSIVPCIVVGAVHTAVYKTKAPVLLELRFYWEETNHKHVNYIVYRMVTNVKKENKEGEEAGAATLNSVVKEGLTGI